jgi:hypothetical protein
MILFGPRITRICTNLGGGLWQGSLYGNMVKVKASGAQYRAVPDFSNSKCDGLIRNLILSGFKIRQNNLQKRKSKTKR